MPATFRSYCYECEDCADGTSGPCRHATEGDNTCFPYVFGTTCPVGTYSCATFEAGGGVPGSEDGESEPDFQFIPPTTPQTCGGCLGGSGPCVHQNDFSCHDYMEGTTICPPGTEACTLCSGCNGGFGPCRHQVRPLYPLCCAEFHTSYAYASRCTERRLLH